MSGRKTWEQVPAWFLTAVFCTVFVGPILYAAFYLNDFASGSGRLGLILPAIVLADAQNRQALLMAFVGSFSAVLVAFLIGTCLGLAAANTGSRMYRAVRAIALLPGRVPAWIFPACYAVGQLTIGIRPIPESMTVYVWIAWVAWWGATRIADILAKAVRSVTRSEWDAARTLAGGSLPIMKVALLPRVAMAYRKEAKRIAGVCLFDPTPVFFLGIANWPMGHVSRLFAAGDLRSAVDACAWLVWLIFIWSIIACAFRLACGNHSRQNPVVPKDEIPSDIADIPVARSGAWLIPAMWPVLSASVALAAACARHLPNASGGSLGEIAERQWAWVTSLAFGSGVTLTAVITVAILARIGDVGRAVRILNALTSFWPLEAAICSVGVLAILADRFLEGQSPVILGRIADEVWSPVFLFFLAAGIGNFSIRQRFRNSARIESPEAIARAASDAARTLGIPKRRADMLASETLRRNQAKIPAATVLLSAWWLWNSPSWALVPNWRISSVMTGGQMLMNGLSEHDGQGAGLAGVAIVLGVATILTCFEWIRASKIRQR